MISMFDNEKYGFDLVADMLSISKTTLLSWETNGKLIPEINPESGLKEYNQQQLSKFDVARKMFESVWESELNIKPLKNYTSIELFAGGGGLAIGLEKAGFNAQCLNEIDKHACHTLRKNRPLWNVLEGDIKDYHFKKYQGKIDLLSGGFPCQAFSYAGKQRGFSDTRGTLFFEFARVLQECTPKVFMAENVKGLVSHDNGRTLSTIKSVLKDLGYTLLEPRVLKAIFYQVPQKRERLIIIGIRNDLAKKAQFSWPAPYKKIMTVKDALKTGELYNCDVPQSLGQTYPQRKAEILSYIPQGGYWRDLSDDLQREYMKKSYFLGGGKTGMARRLAWNAPSLTLTCAPAQKQTERCHPEETRPLTVREYARIQTFPDEWLFSGSITSQYKQIGNAVPVNLAYALGRSLIKLCNDFQSP